LHDQYWLAQCERPIGAAGDMVLLLECFLRGSTVKVERSGAGSGRRPKGKRLASLYTVIYVEMNMKEDHGLVASLQLEWLIGVEVSIANRSHSSQARRDSSRINM
jgi:hypothetical protein